MKIAVICFSLTGQETGDRLVQGLESKGYTVSFSKKSRYLKDSIKESLQAWTQEQFIWADGIIFIGACGIAVRSIAPYIKSKKTDPAVIVADECGKYVISLLAGHLGGANELSQKAAEILGAIPVVTTATDIHGMFAVDVFAKRNGCNIFNMEAAKEVSAALLAGETIGFYSDFPYEEELPKGLIACNCAGEPLKMECGLGNEKPRTGVSVSIYKNMHPFSYTASVVPPTIVVGVGCRKGKTKEELMGAVNACIEKLGIYREAIGCFASIDLKKEEVGIMAMAEAFGVPFLVFSEEELCNVPGQFTASGFVKKVAGVDNVCERSAVIASGIGELIQKKICRDGVTTAAAEKKWRICFE